MKHWIIFSRSSWSAAAAAVACAWTVLGAAPPAIGQPTLADIFTNGASSGPQTPSDSAEPTPATAVKEAAPAAPADELGRETPRSSVRGFLAAAGEGDYEAAAAYLDVGRLPAGVGMNATELAHALKVVLDRKLWIDLDSLSDERSGREGDGLPASRELVGEIAVEDGRTVGVLLQRVTDGGVQVWKFASPTLAQVPDLYERFGYGILERYLPAMVFELRIAGVPLIEWAGVVVAVVVAFVLAYFITGVVTWLLRRSDSELSQQVSRFVKGPLRLAVGVMIFAAGEQFLHLTVTARAILNALEAILMTAAVAWTALRLVDVFGTMLTRKLIVRGQGSAVSAVPPARKAVKVLVVAFALIAMLGTLGFNITALIAGLGVGGIAFALAAQKTIENMFGGITLFANQPVRVGDFCRFGDNIGTVEDIGLYSTRVRTNARTVITVPNADFAGLQIENFTRRDKIWYHPTLGLRYETTPDQIRYILVAVREMLYSHPKVDPEPARVRFVGFGASSLDLEVFAYVQVTDFGEYLEVAEDLNLRIMDIIEEAGSGFAFPSQTTYIEQGEGVDREAAERAEQRVAEWRAKGELFLPGFPRERIGELRGRLDYPPDGSPLHASRDGRGGAAATK